MFNNTMKCKTCNKEISKNAKSCPECGHDYSKKEGGVSLTSFIIVSVGIIWAVSSLSTDRPSASTTTKTSYKKVHTEPAATKSTLPEPKPDNTAILKNIISDLKKQYAFSHYKQLTLPQLNEKLQNMRTTGRLLILNEDTYKKDDIKLYKEAKALQIKVQKKHYPKMRDALGPLMREKMWEHDIHVKTIGQGYNRMVLSGVYFASNRNIKSIKDSISILLSDYRFKRVDFKWMKGANEWTYYDLSTKKDSVL